MNKERRLNGGRGNERWLRMRMRMRISLKARLDVYDVAMSTIPHLVAEKLVSQTFSNYIRT
jgi:hypothetical protein